DPDATSHGFNQVLADVESQARPTYCSGQVTLETHKFLKEQRKLLGGDARTCILHTETHRRKRSRLRGLNTDHRLRGHILEDIAEQILQHAIQVLPVRP